MKRIDVVIPVYKPGKEFQSLISRLGRQEVGVQRILLMHTQDGYDLSKEPYLAERGDVVITSIDANEFDHGGTRDLGMSLSDAEFVICMTQDAIPADQNLINQLVQMFEDPKVAVAYARQLPKKDCRFIERYTRSFNYPAESMVKSAEDLERLGIKTYFCSNVCAMYRKSVYEELGGFEKKTIFNEDMLYAAKCIKSGYKIAYAADAKVYHSHNYSNKEQFQRNFDLAVSQADHPEVFGDVKSESEGVRMILDTAKYLIQQKHPLMIISLVVTSSVKYLGYLCGKNYFRFPRKIVLKFTMNPRYWNRKQNGSKK